MRILEPVRRHVRLALRTGGRPPDRARAGHRGADGTGDGRSRCRPLAGPTDPILAPAPPARPRAAVERRRRRPAGPTTPGATERLAAPPASATAPRRRSPRGLAGTWKISDAARGNCSIALTQQSLLDLYRASPSGCQAGSLAKVNAWQQRGQEIVLLEPGGRTAVRLFPKGDGTYEGAATTSGAIVRMSR